MTGALLDTLLDRSIVLGYSKIGYAVRSAAWGTADLPRMDGKVVLVTGASSGLGLAAAEGFARLGASVRLLVRDAQRGERAASETARETGNADVRPLVCDLADLGAIRAFAASFAATSPRLDVLVNNAGVLTRERMLSRDGIELTFATNVLALFALTNLLTELLRASAPARIINVSSGGMYTQRLHSGDLQSTAEPFDGPTAYARSKRAQVILTELFATLLKPSGVCVQSMHPGWVDTPGLRTSLPRFYAGTRRLLRSPQEGADTIVWLGAAAAGAGDCGSFWHDRRKRPTDILPWTKATPAERERLWAECERLSA